VPPAEYPDDLRYHPAHDWARVEGEVATLGITWFAQDAVGEIVFFDPPDLGTTVGKDESYAEIESVKAVSDVIAPLSGEVVEVNQGAAEDPAVINSDPYGSGWLVKIRIADEAEIGGLLSATGYRELLTDG
jgi:glycine cleavage system H protein